MTFCGNCGTSNPVGNRFCFNCGADLTLVNTPGEQSPPYQGAPVMQPGPTGPVERIGAYNPNADYSFRPMQQPPIIYQYQQPMYPPQQQGYYYPPMYPPQQPMYAPPMMQPAPGPGVMTKKLEPAPKCRWLGILFSLLTFALTAVAVFVLPINGDFSNFDHTIFQIGMQPDNMVLLVFACLVLVIGILAIIVPSFSVVTGVCLLGIVLLIYMNKQQIVFTTEGIIIIALCSVIIMCMGIVASSLMKRYVRGEMENVTLFNCCIKSWTGVKH